MGTLRIVAGLVLAGVFLTAAAPAPPQELRMVTLPELYVRTGPSTRFSALGHAHYRETYPVLERHLEWIRIPWNGTEGWVFEGYTVPAPPGGVRRYEPTVGERTLLYRTVMAEAGGETYEGQMAVAAVVINRVQSPGFPKTMRRVLRQPWAFTPVTTGAIWAVTPSRRVRNACEEALNGKDPSLGALHFYNPRMAAPDWIRWRRYLVTIGDHRFYE